jgi:hypothetical protein
MASFTDEAGRPATGGTSGRRDFMRKAAVVGTGAFVTPTIITVDAAEAQALTSPPPEPPGRPGSPPDDVGGAPGTVTPRATGTQPPAQAIGSRAAGRTELPRTGADLDRLIVAGLAATAGGAALVLWSADAKATSSKIADSTSETSPVTGDRPPAIPRERLNRR